MTAYYNENDPYAARWLENLIQAGLIAPGDVDSRDIRDVSANDLKGYTQCHFFAGIGVWSYALRKAGWPDDRPVWTGSCPCQPFSQVGSHRRFEDPRHLWPSWFSLIRECQPPVLFGEQVASEDALEWFDVVHSDLEAQNYAVGATDLCAASVGAPHIRQRLWFVAESSKSGLEGRSGTKREALRPNGQVDSRGSPSFWHNAEWLDCRDGKRRPIEPGTSPLAYGPPARVGRLCSYGNAIVSEVAQTFIESYMEYGMG